MYKVFLLVITSLFLSVNVSVAQSIEGQWKTIDDETGKAKSVVDVKLKDGKLYGEIIKLYRSPEEDQDPVCEECTDHRKGKKVIGMTIITALEKDGDEWEADDAILDPNNGKIYDCKVWVDEDNPDILNVRGYIGFVYRTQNWKRVK